MIIGYILRFYLGFEGLGFRVRDRQRFRGPEILGWLYTSQAQLGFGVESPDLHLNLGWVAVKELNLSYYVGETLLFTIYTHYGNLT